MKHNEIKDGLWMYNFGDPEHWNEDEYFDTESEAIDYGRIEAIKRGESKYQVGEMNVFKPGIDVEDVIEQVSNDAYDNCGEFAEDYLSYLPKTETDRLQELLTEVFEKWLDETNNRPSFFTVVNISDHTLEQTSEYLYEIEPTCRICHKPVSQCDRG